MKKVIITAVLLMVGMTVFAQRGRHYGQSRAMAQDLSVEQLATLRTKKMTLALDLTEKQQQQVMQLNLENVKFKRTTMEERRTEKKDRDEKPTAEEQFAFENQKLDRQIAQQEKMKKILDDDQYQLWKRLRMHQYAQGKKRMKKEGRS
ncbi:hypothetical protein [uncultured Croceitalea sp.]|uniref:hypothetical protein n=1 Tax=uncultured Croceitalea sp. TaxID=1798908 RepID=UPI00330561D9